MIKIRINNDINLAWTIYRLSDSGKFPEDFSGADIVEMYIFNKQQTFRYYPAYTILEGTFRMEFAASRQKQLGEYNLYLQYKKDGDTHTIDSCKAFELVDESCKQSLGVGSSIDPIMLESQVDLLPAIIVTGGTGSYDQLTEKPKINNVELKGNVSLETLGIESSFEKNTAFNADYGTEEGTACEGNDPRLSDERKPLAHNQAWSTITSTPTTLSGYGIEDGVVITDPRLADDRNAKDVPLWAKNPTKPTYTPEEVGAQKAGNYVTDLNYVHTDNNFTTLLKQKLESLNNYDDATIQAAVTKLQNDLNKLVDGDVNGVIDSFNEIEAFLSGITETDSLSKMFVDLRTEMLSKTEASQLYVPKEGYISFSQTEKERLAAVTQPTSFKWVDGMYQPASVPPDFNEDVYQISACAFEDTNPIDNPMMKIGEKVYALKINDQLPLKFRISKEEICSIWFFRDEARMFGLDSNRATVEEAQAGDDKNKYITPETMKVVTDAVSDTIPQLATLTQEEYDALPDDKLSDNKYYFTV